MKKLIGFVFIIMLIFFYIMFMHESQVLTIDMTGYLLTSNDITTKLHNENLKEEDSKIESVLVDSFSEVYKRNKTYYVKKAQKETINIEYPVISPDGSRLLNISANVTAINQDFESLELYKDVIIASGNIYNNISNEQMDTDTYFFLELPNNIFINNFPLEIQKETETITIPTNSYIYFSNNEIRYYYFTNEEYKYNAIRGIDLTHQVKFSNKQMSYEKLLVQLKLKAETLEIKTEEEEQEPPKEEEENPPSLEEPTPTDPTIIYVKPEVSVDNIAASVYSVKFNLNIKDQAARIKKYPTFEIYINEKLYMRKTTAISDINEITGLLPDTKMKVIGYFTYLNEQEDLIKATFLETEITTTDITNLSSFKLNYGNISSNTNQIFIEDMFFENNIDEEIYKGLKKVVAEIDGKEYAFGSSLVTSLKRQEKVTYESPSLNSNKEYELTIKAYDVAGNELKVENNKLTGKTAKKAPLATIKIDEANLTYFKFSVGIDNPDNVYLHNLRYVVLNTSNEIMEENTISKDYQNTVNNLESNQIYTLILYADYDLEDGAGNLLNQKLKEVQVSTTPISSLGYLRLNFKEEEILSKKASFNLSINADNTDERLVNLLDSLEIKIRKKGEADIVKNLIITKDNLENLKKGQTILLEIEDLFSNTEYELEMTSFVKQGDITYNIEVLSNLNEFKTLKKESTVEIINKFSTSSMIDFDAKVIDEDGAIEGNRVLLEVRDSSEKLIALKEIGINKDYTRFTFEKLNENTTYTVSYKAESYNTGHTDITLQEDKVLKEDTFVTNEGINGTLVIDTLLSEITSKNLIDIYNTNRWKSTTGTSTITQTDYNEEENAIYFSAENGYRNYAYYLKEYAGEKITVSFEAKYDSSETKLPVYLANGDGATKSYQLTNLNNDWKKYTFTFNLNSKGYLGFYIDEVANNNTTTKIGIRNLQVELGISATSYEKYNEKETYNANILATLNDTKDEIATDDFYIQVYKKEELINTYHYDLENKTYVSNMPLKYEVEKNTTYTLALCVKIRDRLYTINELTFTTDQEIRTIKTIEDFYNVHTTGKYLVANDLDFTKSSTRLNTPFSGEIDFQGHKVLMDVDGAPADLIYRLTSSGVLSNIDLHFYFNNQTARGSYYGFIENLEGRITNIKVTIEESTNVANEVISLLAYVNRGTIENFVIHAKAPLSGKRWITYGCLHNYGIMKNGYVYGEAINATYPTNSSDNKRVGALAGYTSENSRIENVYALVDIDIMSSNNSNYTDQERLVGNIVGENNRGILNNIFSYASGENRDLSLDPNIGNSNNSINVNTSNLFYASDELYGDKYSLKISKLALKDTRFQSQLLNGENKFNIDDLVPYGYYPQIIWPDCMPNQDYIALPEVKDDDLVDIISVESVERQEEKSIVTLNISNPSNEKISEIVIKDVTTKILSQETAKGKTILTVEISEPTEYVSKYYMVSITTLSAFNIPFTRTYTLGERVLQIDLYREINSINDWSTMKNKSNENYILMTDLDFKNQPSSIYYIGNFSGKLNGNNHTIKNIEILSGNSVISTLTGTVENLKIENYSKSNKTTYAGFIDYASTNSLIDNVHIKNVKLIASSHIGGLIGYANGAVIRDSSVNDLSLYDVSKLLEVRIGGLVGYSVNTSISNCYASNVMLDLTKANIVYSAGGLVGELGSGTITNAYTTGEIKTNSQETGGIVGRNNGIIKNVYSNLDIYSKNDYIGGIVGNSLNTYISNTLSVGALYTSSDVENIRRTVGNTNINQSNSAWTEQHMNGKISNLSNGETLYTTELLNSQTTYTTFINLGSSFSYNEIGDNSLPLLLSTDGEILINQSKNYLKEYSFEVTDITTDKEVNKGTILLTISNPNNYPITKIELEDLNITKVNKNVTINGETTYEVEVTPEKYYDSYRLTKIYYRENGIEKEYEHEVKIDFQFYKDLEKYEDWQNIDSSTYENYRLVADIDFLGKNNVNSKVSMNRLIGTEDGHTLKNITLNFTTSDDALISSIRNEIKNINFENITINNTGSGNRTGIIDYAFGEVTGLNFTNIQINASKMNYAGIIAQNRTSDIRNVTLKEIRVSGKSYVGAFIAKSRYYGLTNVTLNNITVTGSGNYVGGMTGHIDWITDSVQYNITADTVSVTNTGNYTGGIFGYGNGNNIKITNGTIKGVSYVGGISGQQGTRNSYYNYVIDSNIEGSGSNIGGVFGNNENVYYAYLKNSEVTGTSLSANNVGGISGTGGWTIYYTGVSGSTISSKGKYVGGIKGLLSWASIDRVSVTNTIAQGAAYVGGAVGGHTSVSNQIRHATINANVIATSYGAGGVIGYVNNINTDTSSNRLYIYNTIVENTEVTAPYEAGGVIGKVDVSLFNNYFYNILVSAKVTTTNKNYSPGIILGVHNEYASNIRNLRIYENSELIANGKTTLVGSSNIPGISQNQYVTLSQLETQSTYTSIGLSTSYFDFTTLKNKNYPVLKTILTDYLEYVPLPTATKMSLSTLSLRQNRRLMAMREYHEMPTYTVYVSGINKVNIEFSKIDTETALNINGFTTPIEERTYSFSYNYKDDLNITLTDGLNEKTQTISASEIKKNVITYEDGYYILKEDKLISNKINLSDKILNAYDNYLLLENGNIYNVKTNEIIKEEEKIFEQIPTQALFTGKYNNSLVEAFYNYSLLNKTTVVEKQILIRNTQIEIVSTSLDIYKEQIIMDSYNDKEHLSVLGTDGILYDLKSAIKKPTNFKNKNIKEISTNINNNSNIIVVLYENNDIVVFNYKTGTILYSSKNKNINILEYFAENISFEQGDLLSSTKEEDYEVSLKLTKELENASLENKITSQDLTDKSYIQVYDPLKKNYEVYEINALLDGKINSNISQTRLDQSITDILNANYQYQSFYKTTLKGTKEKRLSTIVIFVSILICILVSIVLLAKLLKKRYFKEVDTIVN